MPEDALDGASGPQRDLAEMPNEPILLLAPPGCGKTEALAFRAAGLIEGRHVKVPQRLLALTFSNKARDNLRDRLRHRLGPQRLARFVTVQNFHGFAARIVNGHRHLLGLPSELEMPDRRWATGQLQALGASRPDGTAALDVIRTAKQSHLGDDAVADAVQASGNELAIELERRRLEDSKIDYDDLIRYGVALLEIEGVRRLYRCHFAAVLVDEMQDMTPRQLDLALLVGSGRTTLAGDAAQGIYSFAGARPDEVATRYEGEEPVIIVLTENYRSAPAILNLVSAMARSLGGAEVSCAQPDEWLDDGEIRVLRFASAPEEANAVIDMAQRLIRANAEHSVGVMARTHFRKQWVEEFADQRGLDFECWDRAVDTPAVRTVLHRAVARVSTLDSPDLQMEHFASACLEDCPADDVDLRDGVLAGLDVVNELCGRGIALAAAVGSLAIRSSDVVAPGLHFLNAHVGKGQQFDWVVILGLEDGSIPSYLAKTAEEKAEELRVLHVMCSRAKRGLVFTASRDVRWNPEREWLRDESPWLPRIEEFSTGEGDPTIADGE